jgi:hypothetical protein
MSLYWVLARKPKYTLDDSMDQMIRLFINGLASKPMEGETLKNPEKRF